MKVLSSLLLLPLAQAQASCLAHYVSRYEPDAIQAAHTAYLIKQKASLHRLPVSLLAAVVQAESTFRPKARNGQSIGLMQVIPRWHRARIGNRDIWNPHTNLDVGASFLRRLLNKYPTAHALLKYNGHAIGPRYAQIVFRYQRNIRKACPSIS